MADKRFGAHEFQDRETVVKSSSDRNFGFVFTAFFGIVTGIVLYSGGTSWPVWAGLSVLFGAVTLVKASLLAPLNRLWTKFGLLLAAVISPIVLGLVYYLCITPIGLLLRLWGKDLLRLKMEPESDSYWIAREPPGPTGESLDRQF